MECRYIMLLAALLGCVDLVTSLDTFTGKGSVVARDTDKAEALREELANLSDLVAAWRDVDESDLHQVASQKRQGNNAAQSYEDMREEPRIQQPVLPQEPQGTETKKSQLPTNLHDGHLPEDSSIQILAKALSRLRDPYDNSRDSTGEDLGKNPDASSSDQVKTQKVQDMIEQALHRLSQDKTQQDSSDKKTAVDRSQNFPVFNKQVQQQPINSQAPQQQLFSRQVPQQLQPFNSRVPQQQQPLSQSLQWPKTQGIKFIEHQVMQALQLGEELGISVNDIIQDLDIQAYQETHAGLEEDELDSLRTKK